MTTLTWPVLLLLQLAGFGGDGGEWGFFSHRLINRMAVFTLPAELIGVYKQHIAYVTEHAVDPDKRRYATRHEAVRHYIDIDHWGTYPFDNVPRTWNDALLWKMQVLGIIEGAHPDTHIVIDFTRQPHASRDSLRRIVLDAVLPQYYEDEWVIDCAILPDRSWCQQYDRLIAREQFTQYGILPYHLVQMQRRLTAAFEARDLSAVLRLSADFGHYIADAHVPLHTTENYNGQLTGQTGIHAFWETRIPEIMADSEFDFMVGRAEYIRDPQTFYWDIVLKSHTLVGEVLETESRLRSEYPTNAQFCFEERLEVTTRTQCEAYARAYHAAMNGMVEERMREAVHAIGSAWYTAWVDGGQPEFEASTGKLSPHDEAAFEELERQFRLGEIKGRAHRN